MTAAEQRRLLRENRWICIQIEQYGNHCLAHTGLTSVQAYILLYILRHSDRGTSLTDIHREFGYSMGTLSGVLKRLRAKGCIRSAPCDGADRRKLLFGTEEGRRIGPGLEATIARMQARLCGRLSQEELDTLSRLQRKMLDSLLTLREQREKEDATS